jgi:hypothetical protein
MHRIFPAFSHEANGSSQPQPPSGRIPGRDRMKGAPMLRYRTLVICLIWTLSVGGLSSTPRLRAPADTIPERLGDQEFWKMTEEFSEPSGFFRSDNLLSNEMTMQYVVPELVRRTQPGGAYMGVGPEQNFTYIAALKPKIVFITDIRRGNTHTQLMYKALFELSADRADFVARLFTRKRPEGLTAASSAQEIFRAIATAPVGTEAAFKENLKEIQELLGQKHKFNLAKGDLEGIEYVYHSFFTFGPAISYNSTGQGFGGRSGNFSTYADIMTQTDENNISRGYLANEDNYKVVKNLEEKNLIIPLVGDFGGPKAIRSVGKYLKEHGATVAAFYLSNVEQYLGSNWSLFCANVASLPLDEKSTFIRSSRGSFGGPRGGLITTLGSMLNETKGCGASVSALHR